MAQAAQTPFAEPAQQAPAPATDSQARPETVEAVVDPGKPNQYKLVKSATGKTYVEANEYDPLEQHRSRDPKANKGEGLGFLFCCCRPQTEEVAEPIADRHYSIEPAAAPDAAARSS